MLKDNTLAIEVGHRLRATAYELGFRSQQSLADWLGAQRAQVAAWYNGIALLPVKYMRKLAAERGVTLDWIYRGDGSALSNAVYIRLAAAMEDDKPPPDVAPEPETEPETVTAYPLRKALDCQPPPTRPKRATAA